MDAQDIERLLSTEESEWIERKSSLTDKAKIRQAICAFANDLQNRRLPGYILVGLDDAGNPTGKPIDDQTLQELSFLKDDGHIQPMPQLAVERVAWKGCALAVVTVQPSIALPVRCDGIVWIRVGPRRSRATADEERRLTERDIATTLPFDSRPCLAASLDDLNTAAFLTEYLPRVIAPDVLAENHRPLEFQMRSLRLYDLHRAVPTHAGILGFGKQPKDYLPGAYIQFVRYDGRDRAAAIFDHKEIGGRLQEQLLRLDALLPIQIQQSRASTGGLIHKDQPDYPLAALREFVLNAIMHRSYEGTNAPVRLYWYSDRVEIQSPGGLYGHVTAENFQHVNEYRNPVVAELLKGLGAIERFGSGISRAQAALAQNGNPPAEFTFEPTHVLVTVRTRPLHAQPLTTPARIGSRRRRRRLGG